MKGSLAPTCEADGVPVMKSLRPGLLSQNSFFPSLRSALLAGVAIAGLLAGSASLRAQTGDQSAASQTTANATADCQQMKIEPPRKVATPLPPRKRSQTG